jgi:hypothetical protein
MWFVIASKLGRELLRVMKPFLSRKLYNEMSFRPTQPSGIPRLLRQGMIFLAALAALAPFAAFLSSLRG